jgi:hypothetical protein
MRAEFVIQLDVLEPDHPNLARALGADHAEPKMFDALAQARSKVRAGASRDRRPERRSERQSLLGRAGCSARVHRPA